MSYFDLGNTRPTQLVARQGYGAVDGILSTIGGAIKDAAKGALSIYGDSKTAAGQAQAATTIATAAVQQPQRGGMPAWLLPVAAVGGLGLVALLVLKPKGRRNPARRVRRRRRRTGSAMRKSKWVAGSAPPKNQYERDLQAFVDARNAKRRRR